MEEKLKILLCEDDENLGMLLREYLQAKNFECKLCPDGEIGYREFFKEKYDICVLDVMMPKKDGFTLAQEIRQSNAEVPIIFLTAKTLKEDILEGFKLGADGYITKPFSPSVLCAKVKACLRRMSLSAPSSSGVLSAGPFCYFSDEMRLLKKGIEVPLSSKESFLMKYFLTNQNKVLTKEQIYRSIWGDNVVDDNTIMVHIRRLRTKIEDDPNKPLYLRTIRGVGYQFVAE